MVVIENLYDISDDGQVEKVVCLVAYLAEAKRLNMAAVDQAIQSNNIDQLRIEGKTFYHI